MYPSVCSSLLGDLVFVSAESIVSSTDESDNKVKPNQARNMVVILANLLGNYDRQSNRLTNRPANPPDQTAHREVTLSVSELEWIF